MWNEFFFACVWCKWTYLQSINHLSGVMNKMVLPVSWSMIDKTALFFRGMTSSLFTLKWSNAVIGISSSFGTIYANFSPSVQMKSTSLLILCNSKVVYLTLCVNFVLSRRSVSEGSCFKKNALIEKRYNIMLSGKKCKASWMLFSSLIPLMSRFMRLVSCSPKWRSPFMLDSSRKKSLIRLKSKDETNDDSSPAKVTLVGS